MIGLDDGWSNSWMIGFWMVQRLGGLVMDGWWIVSWTGRGVMSG